MTGNLKLIKIFLLSFYLLSCKSFSASDLQDIANQLQKFEDPKYQYEIGFKTSSKILGSAPLINIGSTSNYLNLVGKTLVKNSNLTNMKWTFAAIDTSDINAFATSGGFIFITKGLLKELKSEDELAAVIAHEIAHIKFNHYFKVVRKQILSEYSLKSLSHNNDEQLDTLANTSTLILAKGLDKKSEFEADKEATIILYRSGYNPSSLADVLNILEKKTHESGKNMSFLLTTHPHPSQRLEALGDCCADAFINSNTENSKTTKRFNNFINSL